MRTVLFLLALTLSFSSGQGEPAGADVETRLNFSFEHSDGDQPSDWASSGWQNAPYKVYLTHQEAYQGAKSVIFRCEAQTCGSGAFGVVTKRLSAQSLVGKELKLRGFLKTDAVEGGYAGLWMRVDGAFVEGRPEQLAFDNMSDRGVTGTQGLDPLRNCARGARGRARRVLRRALHGSGERLGGRVGPQRKRPRWRPR